MLTTVPVQSAQVLWYSYRLIRQNFAVFLGIPLKIPVPGLSPLVLPAQLQRCLLQCAL